MNTLTLYPVPDWISILFMITIPLPFILIAMLVRKEAQKLPNPSVFGIVVAFYVAYLIYIAAASYMGWFDAVSLPPRVLLITTFPYALFLFGYVLNNKTFQSMLSNVSLESLVKLHVFRVIGVFFVLLALHDALPKPFAFIAGFGDMITAVSSIFVAKALKENKSYALKLTYYWNIFGTVDILFTAIAANVLTKISMDTGSMGVDTLAKFPFCIIPAFAPPTILLLHWLIFKKIKEK